MPNAKEPFPATVSAKNSAYHFPLEPKSNEAAAARYVV